LPLLFFGIVSLFIAFVIVGGLRSGQNPPLPVLIVPVLAAAFIYFVMKKLIFDLVDEVLDAGDALIVRNRGQEDRIAFSDIVNVNYTPLVSPPRVTLALRRASVFGPEVTFCAPLRFVPFSSSPVINELIQRIDAARRR
jgi:hypothetical protein